MNAPVRRLGAALTLSFVAVASLSGTAAVATTAVARATAPSATPTAAPVTATMLRDALAAQSAAAAAEAAAVQAVAAAQAGVDQAVAHADAMAAATTAASVRIQELELQVIDAQEDLRAARASASILLGAAWLLDLDDSRAKRRAAVAEADGTLARLEAELIASEAAAAQSARLAREAAVVVPAHRAGLDQANAGVTAATAAHAAAAAGVNAVLGQVDPAAHRLLVPTAGDLTSPFGMRVHPVTGAYKQHTGLDLAHGDGQIYAAAGGTVVSTGYDGAYGSLTVIDHGLVDGQRLTTWYAHQAGVSISVGQTVTVGQPIGRVGSTGLSTGPHLHFEVRLDDQPVDPAPWIF